MPPCSGGRQTGFTLLEVLVAFVVATIGVVALLQGFSGGLRNLGRMDEYANAALVTESRLAEVGIVYPVEAGELAGVEEGKKYRWRVSITPFEDPDGLIATADETTHLYLVEVDVSWAGGIRSGHFVLRSLRLGA